MSEPQRKPDTKKRPCVHKEWQTLGTWYTVTPDPNWSMTPTREKQACCECGLVREVLLVNAITITE